MSDDRFLLAPTGSQKSEHHQRRPLSGISSPERFARGRPFIKAMARDRLTDRKLRIVMTHKRMWRLSNKLNKPNYAGVLTRAPAYAYMILFLIITNFRRVVKSVMSLLPINITIIIAHLETIYSVEKSVPPGFCLKWRSNHHQSHLRCQAGYTLLYQA